MINQNLTNKNPTNQNLLLQKSSLPFGCFPFNLLKHDDYLPALDEAIARAKANIARLLDDAETPSFKNTVLALETADEAVSHVATIFFNMLGTNTDSKMQELAREFSPKLSNFSSDLALDPKLFNRVKSVWSRRDELKLQGEDWMLTDRKYKSFVRNGALLNEADKEKLREIDQELSKLTPEFSDNVLKATNAFQLFIQDEKELDGLPASAMEAYKEAATAAGRPNEWLVTLHAPSYVPFMTYASKRALREKLWKAYGARAFTENQPLIKSIVSLRDRRAKLLGFKSHAAFVLEERMAGKPETVMGFLERLLDKVMPAARRDLNAVKALKKQVTGDESFEAWDYTYWSEKLKATLHDFDEEELRPYFKLENVIDGVFEHGRRLYGIDFKLRTDIPTFHEDVRTYEVRDIKTSQFVGLFYADFFPRESKRGGAWMTTYLDQGYNEVFGDPKDGKIVRPHVGIVCNFTKPTATAPSLLTLDEVKTLFHEFGHALHGLLSQCKYTSLGGTHVYWDFVELPSQIMENWVSESESLSLFAKHYQTGEVLPSRLIEKIKKTAQFQSGYFALRQLNFGLLDMAWHSADPANIGDVVEFEKKVTERTSLFAPTPGVGHSMGFTHIFAGGYSAGYYSYKWAEVLDADAFEYFKEKGLFNADVASKFKEFVLSKGGSELPMDLYKKFRGREPDPDALLRRDGLLS